MNDYLKAKISYEKLFNPSFDETTVEGKKALIESLYADLSPENLHCDGEASPRRVATLSKIIKSLIKKLEKEVR